MKAYVQRNYVYRTTTTQKNKIVNNGEIYTENYSLIQFRDIQNLGKGSRQSVQQIGKGETVDLGCLESPGALPQKPTVGTGLGVVRMKEKGGQISHFLLHQGYGDGQLLCDIFIIGGLCHQHVAQRPGAGGESWGVWWSGRW